MNAEPRSVRSSLGTAEIVDAAHDRPHGSRAGLVGRKAGGEHPRIAEDRDERRELAGTVPSGQTPQSVQSPWGWTPGPVSKRSSGSALWCSRSSTTRRRKLVYQPVYAYPSTSSRWRIVARRSGQAAPFRETDKA